MRANPLAAADNGGVSKSASGSGRPDRVVENQRGSEWHYLLALPDFSYLMVVADRGDYVLPWTQYAVEFSHRQRKYQKEYNAYWAAQKS